MFFSKNPLKDEINQAKELLHLADKVIAFRKDLLSSSDLQKLRQSKASLHQAVEAAKELSSIKKARESLDAIMKTCGGTLYPVRFWSDNVETFLVAAILAIAIRTFFFQPFSIPTNSMYPTYHGMCGQVYHSAAESPNILQRAWRKIKLGSTHYELQAPESGELIIPLANAEGTPFGYRIIKGRKWLGLLPELRREYVLYIGQKPVTFQVPLEFDGVPDIIKDAFSPEQEDVVSMLRRVQDLGDFEISSAGPVWKTGKFFQKGESVLTFDILKGDMLFVDRISYHFKKPAIGDPIVFRTWNIQRLQGPDGSPENKYFIKRMVGSERDELEIKPPVLYRNGTPIAGAAAFEANAKQEEEYPGYANRWDLALGKLMTVKDGEFFAMGDNSPHSHDSRAWGGVPKREAIGKAVFIFYPFSKRWGISH